MTKIKYYCDKCGIEIKKDNSGLFMRYLKEQQKNEMFEINIHSKFCDEQKCFNIFEIQLCYNCNKDFSEKLKKLLNKEFENRLEIFYLNRV